MRKQSFANIYFRSHRSRSEIQRPERQRRLTVLAALIASLFIVPEAALGYSFTLVGHNTGRTYQVNPNGVISPGGVATGSYLEAPPVTRSYTFYGSEIPPGEDTWYETRYQVFAGGSIRASYRKDQDSPWKTFNSKYYHAIEVSPGTGVYARVRGESLAEASGYHKLSSNSSDTLVFDIIGEYQLPSGEHRGLASGVDDEFDIPSLSISGVNYPYSYNHDEGLIILSYIRSLTSPVYKNNALGLNLNGTDMTITNGLFEGNGGATVPSGYPIDETVLSGYTIEIDNLKYVRNKAPLILKPKTGSVYATITGSTFSENTDTALGSRYGYQGSYDVIIADTAFTKNLRGFYLDEGVKSVTMSGGEITDNYLNQTSESSTNTLDYGGAGGRAGTLTLNDVPVKQNIIRLRSAKEAWARGGGIQVGTGTFNRDTFTENAVQAYANAEGSQVYNAGRALAVGGAIDGTNVSVYDSTFTDNAAFASGTTLSDAVGGAICGAYFISSGSVSASQSTFTRNVASAESSVGDDSLAIGGAVASGGGLSTTNVNGLDMYLENTSFVSNTASAFGTRRAAAYGGAFMAEPRKMFTVSVLQNTASASVQFNGNQTERHALAIGGGGTSGSFHFVDSLGGALSETLDAAPWEQEPSRPTLAQLTAPGPAPDQAERGTLFKFDSVTFAENKAVAKISAGPNYGGFVEQTDEAGALGGGWVLSLGYEADAQLNSITISKNTASAVSDGFATPTVRASAGGAVFNFGGYKGKRTVSGLNVSNNLAEAKLNISTPVSSNTRRIAEARAGGLGLSSGDVKVSGSVVFSANKAAATFRPSGNPPTYYVSTLADGGAIFLEYAKLSIDGTASKPAQITGNTAESIVVSGSRITYAYARGGAAYLYGSSSSLTINNGVIANNAARALVAPESFYTNARAQGGAFYVTEGATLELVDTNLINNSAESTDPSTLGSEGGGIYAKGQATVIIRAKNKDVRFSDNKANYGSDISMGGNTTLYLDAAAGRRITFDGTVHVGGTIKQSGAGTVVLPLASSESNTASNNVGDWYLDGGKLVTTKPVTDFSINKLVLNGGTIDMRDGAPTYVWIDTLEALSETPTNLYLDYKGKKESFLDNNIDTFHISTGVNASGPAPAIKLSGINVLDDTLASKVTYFKGRDLDKIRLRVKPLQVLTSSGWLYTFTPEENNPGTLLVSRASTLDDTLPMIIDEDGLDSFAFTSDASAFIDLGQMAGSGDEFSIFGNEHEFTGGASQTGVTVQSGQTVVIDSLAMNRFQDAAIRNKGTLRLNGVSLSGNARDIVNDGIAHLEGGSIRLEKGITGEEGGANSGVTLIEGADVSFAPGSALRQRVLSIDSGSLRMEGGATLEASEIRLSGGELTARGPLTASRFDLGNDGRFSLLGTQAFVDTLSLSGGTLFVDPSYMGVNALADTLDGNVYVGSGSVLRIGSAEGLQQAAQDAGLAVGSLGGEAFTVGAGEAVLALGQPVAIQASSSLVVDASVTETGAGTAKPDTASAYFGPGSLLVMTGHAAEAGGLAGQLSGALAVADGAKVSLVNAKAGKTYTIASGFTGASAEGSGWSGGNVFVSNYALTATGAFTDDGYTITTQSRDIRETFPDLIPVSAIGTMIEEGLNDPDSSYGGIRFLSRALEGGSYLPKSKVQNTVNEVSRIAITAGVQHTALSTVDSVNEAMEHQLSRAWNDASSAAEYGNGWHVWATPLHVRTKTSGMGVSGHSVRDHFTGLAFGVGRMFGSFTAGLSVNGGDGSAKSRGSEVAAKDSHRFAGASLYGSWESGPWNVYGSIGFSRGRHKVSAGLPDSMAIGSQSARIRTTALSADLRAEYAIQTQAADVIPHAGVRLVSLKTAAHGLGDIASYASDRQNVVEFPVGVAVAKSFTAGDWSVRPQFDLSVIPVAGSRKADTKVHFSGIAAEDSVRTRVMDSCSVKGLVRVSAARQNVRLGLDYAIKASSHETDHSLLARFTWKF